MSDERLARAQHYHEIADKLRQLAQQAQIREMQEELFDLAESFDQIATLLEGAGSGPAGRQPPREA